MSPIRISYMEKGVYGDDFHELVDAYAERFKVDMSGYLWYFHTREEGHGSIGAVFFKAPNQRVHRIAVTPAVSNFDANRSITTPATTTTWFYTDNFVYRNDALRFFSTVTTGK